ncbi:MAG TPA: KGG domain-containing protein [Polyangiaceae bacterium]|jgi:hypothetical protein|nr:KGG domain-containing protein [Polyangiaceae bacterium]
MKALVHEDPRAQFSTDDPATLFKRKALFAASRGALVTELDATLSVVARQEVDLAECVHSARKHLERWRAIFKLLHHPVPGDFGTHIAAAWVGSASRRDRFLKLEGRSPMAQQHERGRGFAALDPDEQRRISSAGGRASHESGHAHEWSSAEAKEAGRRGGLAVHHHQRAAFHHETAAHHHHRAAAQRAAGNRAQAELHAETAQGHERRAGEHAEQASLHARDERDENERPSELLPDDRGRAPRSNDEPAERRARSDEQYEDQLEPRRARGTGSEPDAELGPRGDEERWSSRSDERANEDVENGASERSEVNGTARESI